MKLSSSYLPTGRVISIETDEELDLTSHSVFVDACRLAEYPKHGMIDVDLMRTRNIRASGMAMLLMLYKLTGWERSRIRLLNCHPEIRKQLMRSQVGQQFQVV
jgi:anti-anti-sigma regulatory factor